MFNMKYTGERIVLEAENCRPESFTFNEHISRYNFVRKFLRGKKILDIACGVGYGSKILHDAGSYEIYGCDISNESIKYAKNNFGDKNTNFQIMDAGNIGFKDESFDCIISLETIEHLQNYQMAFQEFYRLLKKDGMLIISTPNKNRFNRPKNPFHYKEFTKDELIQFLNEYFSNVILYSQLLYLKSVKRRILRSLMERIVKIDFLRFRRILGRKIQDEIFNKIDNTNKQFEPILYKDEHCPKTFITVCKKEN